MRRGLAALPILLFGCHLDPAPDGQMPGVDDQEVLSEIGHKADFAAMTSAAYPSQLGNSINVWVTSTSQAAYAEITPDRQGSQAHVPVGTIIMRQVVDRNGAVVKMTLMCKGPPGYNPDLGDWWFGVLDAADAPMQLGRLTQCYGCHAQRASDDFLFGVPLADRPR